ncbi:MAG: esterase-like activity of phytase family protein [Pseudomonadota bacterium]
MTWMPYPLSPLLALGALLLPASLAAQEYDDILPQTLPVQLDESDPSKAEVGELIYRGGLKIEPGEEKIGGISSLEWQDGALWAVADDGRWLKITTDESNGQLLDLYSVAMGPLLDLRGKKLKGKIDGDAEALTQNPQGAWLVAFEQEHRVWRYTSFDAKPTDEGEGPLALVPPPAPGKGIETLTATKDGGLLCIEGANMGRPNCARARGQQVEAFDLAPPASVAEHGGEPTDAACASDGTCYVLFRSYRPGYGNRAAIMELSTENEARELAVFDAPLTRDNFEGIAVREQFGKRYIYLASDDNFDNCFERERDGCQNTLLMKFEIKNEDGAGAVVPDAEPDLRYETLDVILETSRGDIRIALEVERAPITAANFLRYVDEGRFDGTVFYRAMSLDREPKPNGLLQGGTQFDPDRILPGIEHEPTSQTGLSHTNGAVSMAMGDPGSANGDFSIMLQDQTGLDAQPDASEAIWRNGYAVFGYVVAGMDVVASIHADETDPNKGEGAMRGQILAEPIEIVRARRAVGESD